MVSWDSEFLLRPTLVTRRIHLFTTDGGKQWQLMTRVLGKVPLHYIINFLFFNNTIA